MIKFLSLDIRNFKSIEHSCVFFNQGLWFIEGNNEDVALTSNGAGKSSIIEALQQCLYNKNIKGILIEDTFNRVTGRPYTLTCTFSDDFHSYTVINDKSSNLLYLLKDGVDITEKSIHSTLRLIQSILGMDFNTFCAVTYVSHNTVNSLLDILSSNTLIKTALNFDKINALDDITKDTMKTLIGTVKTQQVQVQNFEDTIKLLNEQQYTDLTALYKLKQDIEDTFSLKFNELKVLETSLIDAIVNLKEAISNINTDIAAIRTTMIFKVCPTCGHKSDFSKELVKELMSLRRDVRKLKADLLKLEGDLNQTHGRIVSSQEEKNSRLNMLNTQISIGEYKNTLYETNKGKVSDINKKLADTQKDIINNNQKVDVYDSVLRTIKSGKLHRDLILNFCNTLNTFIAYYLKDLISYLDIKTVPTKTNYEYTVFDLRTNQFININTLSGGELTRVRLAVLFSTLKTIDVLTQNSTNILVLDEALDTLDKSASQDLAKVFHNISSSESKFIALVSHGEQLSDINFNGTIKVHKRNGITKIIQT